ncbi:MAG TPA: hypothetical protein DEO84_05255 [candidate division Zixibacteria bacterium]|nr:hypothetical protein [candidate division Zixibacteria bacterium]HBZ00715.1 hypothetical protein [candidate division Zixibacteria bacterium]
MLTMLKYAISLLIWAAVAALLLLTGKILYLAFWALLGFILLIIWFGHIIYHIICWFNPQFKPINLILLFIVLIVAAVFAYKVMLQPRWDRWGSTDKEVAAKYKVDEFCPNSELRVVRTAEINVPSEYLFRWVRQMPEAGSYSWDMLDFRHRRSVERLIEDMPDLKEGDDFLIGKVVEVKRNKSITFDIGSDPKFPKLGIDCMYGGYYFNDIGDNKTRVSTVVRADYHGIWGWLYSQVVIEVGDFFMASKQLSNLKAIAEKHFKEKK